MGLLARVPAARRRGPAVLRAPGVPDARRAARHRDPDVARRRAAHGGRLRRPLRALAPRLGVGGRSDLAPRRARHRARPARHADRTRACSTRCRATRSSPSSSRGGRARSSAPGRPGATSWLAAVGVGVALLTLCRPASQVALLACVLVPLVAPRRGTRPLARASPSWLAAAVLPLGAWAAHNAVRYDDFTVARGSKAWVPFFRVGGAVDPANGDASRRLADAVERDVLPLPPYASRGVDVETYFHGARQPRGDPHDRALGPGLRLGHRLRRAVRRLARGDPAPTRGGTSGASADTFWDFLSQRYAPEPRERPVPIPELPAELTIDGKPFPAPITVSPLVAGRALRVRLVPDGRPRAVRRARSRGRARRRRARRGATTSSSTRSATGTRSCRRATRTPGSRARAARRATAGRARSSGSPSRPVALAVRRPRGLRAGARARWASAALVLLVHALSQAPQSEFELPFVPVWIAAALVGLLAPRGAREPSPGTTRRPPLLQSPPCRGWS